jgi:hypothetical protein
VKEEDFKR